MKRKIGDCPRCGRKQTRITRDVCHNCYRKYIWKRKKIECKRCHRMLPMKAKGYCGGCYNTVFMLDYQKNKNYEKYHNIPAELYRKITKKCIVCNFDKVIQLHHIDNNHNNNSVDNMVGLCPNHHKMIHTIEYGEFLQELVERLMTFERFRQKTLIVFEKTEAPHQNPHTDNQPNNPIQIIINKENLVRPCLPN